ncbi:MAG: RND transporter MFP subunit [Oscillospiraceae bacterium]|nr:RND transporter MFP subunit [Oscillospiraceae bacterium]
MKNRIIAIVLTLLLTLTLLAGCGEELPAVYVQSVQELMGYGAMGEFNLCAGVVIARNEVKIERDENRKIAELKVEPGQEVAEGDVLFAYDMDEMQLTIDKAVLEIEQLKNSLTDMDTQIAELEQEKANARESEQLSYTVRIQTLQTNKKETEYNITVKERELETLKTTVGNGEVTSPINGRVKAINENGGYDDYTGMPLPYITLIEAGAYRIKGKVNELNRNDFFVGQTVVVRSRSDAQTMWTGVIAEIDSSPEDSGNDGMYYYGISDEMTTSSSYPFYVDLDSMDGLLLGQHVYIEPDGGQTEVKTGLMLDASYVFGSEEEGFFVWAANGSDRIEKRRVTVGALDEFTYQYEILDGLTAEDRIAFPDATVQEGAPVTDTPSAPELLPQEEIVYDGAFVGGIDDAG